MRCAGRTVEDARRRVDDGREQRRAGRQVVLRVRPDGRVDALPFPTSRSGPAAAFDGRLEPAGASLLLTGEVREAVAPVLLPRLFVVLAVLLGLTGLLVLVDNGPASPGAYVCLGAAAVFAVLARRSGRSRGPAFDVLADALAQQVGAALGGRA